jgi:hypothetical protein
MSATRRHPNSCPYDEAIITRVWKPADGSDVLSDILREVIAANGTLTACIPAVVLTPEDLIAAGTEMSNREHGA